MLILPNRGVFYRFGVGLWADRDFHTSLFFRAGRRSLDRNGLLWVDMSAVLGV